MANGMQNCSDRIPPPSKITEQKEKAQPTNNHYKHTEHKQNKNMQHAKNNEGYRERYIPTHSYLHCGRVMTIKNKEVMLQLPITNIKSQN